MDIPYPCCKTSGCQECHKIFFHLFICKIVKRMEILQRDGVEWRENTGNPEKLNRDLSHIHLSSWKATELNGCLFVL